MSWLWGNETTEQAQFVVSALQTELDERERKIRALEVALKREQQDLTRVLADEVAALETRRRALEQELAAVNVLILDKTVRLKESKTSGRKVKKKQQPSGACSDTAQIEARGACKEVDTNQRPSSALNTTKDTAGATEDKPKAAADDMT